MKETQTKLVYSRILGAIMAALIAFAAMPAIQFSVRAAEVDPNEPLLEGEVYQISSAANLDWFANHVNSVNTSAKAVLTQDIVYNEGDLSTYNGENDANIKKWTPIGDKVNRFLGEFDGNNYTVSGLYVNSNVEFGGLFGCVGGGGKISNVGVVNSYIKTGNYAGGIVAVNYGIIKSCYNTSKITAGQFSGGVCGANYSTLDFCCNSGDVTGSYIVGGVCGASNSTVINCYNTGSVTGGDLLFVGGVCGGNENGVVLNCYNIGSVWSNGYSVFGGGVCGYSNMYGRIENCYSTGSVAGPNTVSSLIGGICGSTMGTVDNCFFLNTAGGANYYGSSMVADEFENGVVSSLLNNRTKILNNVNLLLWVQGDKNPELMTKLPEVIDGVYQISNADELDWFSNHVNAGNTSAKAVLVNDIAYNPTGGKLIRRWTPIGNSKNQFKGELNGNNFVISRLYFSNGNAEGVGLFGYIGENGKVSNVGLVDTDIEAKDYVGGICGWNDVNATIENCYNTGRVAGRNYVGGICGVNSGEIKNCYNTGNPSGDTYVGGVCGWNTAGTIENCYSTGSVTGNNYTGGVCGRGNGGKIESCYYLFKDNSKYTNTNGTAKTADEFKNGAVTALLNKFVSASTDSLSEWCQGDEYPKFGGMDYQYVITASCGENGTMDPSGDKGAKAGESITYKFIPNENCVISNVIVDGESVGAVTEYVFENVNGDHELTCEFEEVPPEADGLPDFSEPEDSSSKSDSSSASKSDSTTGADKNPATGGAATGVALIVISISCGTLAAAKKKNK